MEQADKSTRVADRLLVPHDLFVRPMSLVDLAILVLLLAEALVCLANWEYKEKCMGRPRNECEQLGLVNAEDIVEGEFAGETKLVYERGHNLRVVFCVGMLGQAGLTLIMSHSPKGMNLFLPAGTSGDSSLAMLLMCGSGVAGGEMPEHGSLSLSFMHATIGNNITSCMGPAKPSSQP